MREILFRGKRIDDGEWIEGYFNEKNMFDDHEGITTHSFIRNNVVYFDSMIEVDPSTVGQYTGLKDINGDKIFEGDILQSASGRGEKFLVEFGFYTDQIDGKIYAEEYGWYKIPLPNSIRLPFYRNDNGRQNEMIIGNKYDNPELLEVGQ